MGSGSGRVVKLRVTGFADRVLPARVLGLLSQWKLTGGQTSTSSRASLGSLMQQGAENTQRSPLLAGSPAGGELVPYGRGVRVGVCPRVRPEGWLRFSAPPLVGVGCEEQVPAFAPGS